MGRRTRKTPGPIPADLMFYHWAPRARRNSILKRGLVPGSMSVAREWRPPYICFSDEPRLAWILSGEIHPEIEYWDLWLVHSYDADHWEACVDTFFDTGRTYIKEYRVYHRIFKRDIHFVGSRSQSDPHLK